MAKATKKTTDQKTETKPRTYRTPDEIVRDLEAEIARVRARAAAKQAKADPAAKALLVATKALDKALAVANENKATEIVRALEAGLAPFSTALVELGVPVPAAKGSKRGRKLVAV